MNTNYHGKHEQQVVSAFERNEQPLDDSTADEEEEGDDAAGGMRRETSDDSRATEGSHGLLTGSRERDGEDTGRDREGKDEYANNDHDRGDDGNGRQEEKSHITEHDRTSAAPIQSQLRKASAARSSSIQPRTANLEVPAEPALTSAAQRAAAHRAATSEGKERPDLGIVHCARPRSTDGSAGVSSSCQSKLTCAVNAAQAPNSACLVCLAAALGRRMPSKRQMPVASWRGLISTMDLPSSQDAHSTHSGCTTVLAPIANRLPRQFAKT